MVREHRVYGPPGTGKTTWIIARANDLAGIYGADQISICSLTNASVWKVAERPGLVHGDNISTLHARCKRSQQAGAPAEHLIADFAEKYPRWATTGVNPCLPKNIFGPDVRTGPQPAYNVGAEVSLYEQVNIYRQRLVPEDRWPSRARAWWAVWRDWCRQGGLMDFTGWLEYELEVQTLPPQQVVFVDEAQDHTPLQLAVVRSWRCEDLYLVGDDDQNLYEWSGAVPRGFYGRQAASEIVLEQSYRVPRAVHARALRCIEKVHDRKPKRYLARPAEGRVIDTAYTLKNTRWGELPPGLLEDGRPTMILASAAYMLKGIIDLLLRAGIPFHNPYRPTEGAWNPLPAYGPRVEDYLAATWTGDSVSRWARMLSADVGDRAGLIQYCKEQEEREVHPDLVASFLAPEAAGMAVDRDLQLLEKYHTRKGNPVWKYTLDVYRRCPEAAKRPALIVGTIHSVKGGEADRVYLFPDLPRRAGYDLARASAGRSSAYRMFYVGMTRAKDTLYICSPSEKHWAVI